VLVITGEMIGEIVALAAGMALTAASVFGQNFLMAHHNTVPSAPNAARPKPNTHCLFWTTQFQNHIVSIVPQFKVSEIYAITGSDGLRCMSCRWSSVRSAAYNSDFSMVSPWVPKAQHDRDEAAKVKAYPDAM
jgi:hypothetical protein